MARRGTFGKGPRSSPDLTNSIVALMHEYEALRERNIIDAWKNGGDFEGSRATDAMLLKFFDAKLANLDTDDPLYDEAKNTAEQYRFAVRNSKMELGYAQKNVSDAGMAAFYRKEAGNHPRNSEAWRNLMKLSANYAHRASVGGGGSGASKAAAKARLNARIEYPTRRELGWNTWKKDILDLARQRGIINNSENPDTDNVMSGQGFADLQPGELDYSRLGSLIEEYANSPIWAGRRKELTDFIRANGDPDFDGDFSMTGITKMRAKAVEGMGARLDLAQRKGNKTQVNKIVKSLTLTGKEGAAINVIDPLTHYEEGRGVRDKIVADPNSSVLDRIEANGEWAEQLLDIYDAVNSVNAGGDGGQTSVVSGRILGEWNALTGNVEGSKGTPSLMEEGRPASSGAVSDPTKSDNATTAEMVNKDRADFGLLVSGQAVLTKVGANGKPTDQPGGAWGVVDYDTLNASAPPGTFLISNASPTGRVTAPKIDPTTGDWARDPATGQTKVVDQSTGSILTATPFQPITVVGEGGLERGNATGRPTETLSPKPLTRNDIGGVADLGGGDFVYRFIDSEGNTKYTVTPWWKTEMEDGTPVKVTNNVADGGGITLAFLANKLSSKDGGLDEYDPNVVVGTGARPVPKGHKPTDVVDGFTFDAETNSMSVDVYNSAYVASAVSKGTMEALTPTQIAQGIAVETGDLSLSSQSAMTALSEADKIKAQAIHDGQTYATANPQMQGPQFIPTLTADEKLRMPQTAEAASDFALQQSEARVTASIGEKGMKEVRAAALRIMGMTGEAYDPTGALGLSGMLRRGLSNTMNGVVTSAASDPVFNAHPSVAQTLAAKGMAPPTMGGSAASGNTALPPRPVIVAPTAAPPPITPPPPAAPRMPDEDRTFVPPKTPLPPRLTQNTGPLFNKPI